MLDLGIGGWMYAVGFALLLALGAWCAVRLRRDYQTRSEPTRTSVALVWTLLSLHFCLVVFAAAESVWPLPIPRRVATAAGFVLIVVGTVITAAAFTAFASLWRLSGLDTHRLITQGIYRWSRNPQMVGWTLVLLGSALVFRSGLVLLLAALFWIGLRAYLPLEERLLERLYGQAYRNYCRRTRRYFGWRRERG